MKRIYLLFILLIPFNIYAANGIIRLDTGSPASSDSVNGKSITTYIYHDIDGLGKTFYCMDANLQYSNHVDSEPKVTYTSKSSGFGRGIVGIFAKFMEGGYSDAEASDAVRIFTQKTGNGLTGGVQIGIPISEIQSININNLSRNVKTLYCAGACAAGTQECNSSCTDVVNPSDYNGSNNSEDSKFDVSISKTSEGNNNISGTSFSKTVTLSATGDAESLSNLKIKSCTSSSVNCTYNNDYNSSTGTFSINVSGTMGSGSSATVTINYEGANVKSGTSSSSIDNYSVSIYQCSGSYAPCRQSNNIYGIYQRFAEFTKTESKPTTNSGSVKISINTPNKCENLSGSVKELADAGCCSQIDSSKIEKDSAEEDAYMRSCGDIVSFKYDCGSNSCSGDTSYKAYSESYVRQVKMDILLEGIYDNAKANKPVSYEKLDSTFDDGSSKYLISKVNDYCGVYASEQIDVSLPATAVATSGEFFVFNDYTDKYCKSATNANLCLRQPKVKGTNNAAFITKFSLWKKDYEGLLQSEKTEYQGWQKAVEVIPTLYNTAKNAYNAYQPYKERYESGELDRACSSAESAYQSALSSFTAQGCGGYYGIGAKAMCISLGNSLNAAASSQSSICGERDYARNLKAAFEAAEKALDDKIIEENQHLSALKGYVYQRKYMQKIKLECEDAETNFTDNLYDLEPTMQFEYEQKVYNSSGKASMQKTTVDMNISNNAEKYWPNVSTNVSTKASNSTNEKGEGVTNKTISVAEVYQEQAGALNRSIKNYTDYDKTYSASEPNHEPINYIGDICGVEYGGGANQNGCDMFTYSDSAVKQAKSEKTVYYKPDVYSYSLSKSGEYLEVKTLEYESNNYIIETDSTGRQVQIGYVYNVALSSLKGEYETNFLVNNLGNKYGTGAVQKAINNYLESQNKLTTGSVLASTCNYCIMDGAFSRICDECPDDNPGGLEAQYIYRPVSLTNMNPNNRDNTNWTDEKGLAAQEEINSIGSVAALQSYNSKYKLLSSSVDTNEEDKVIASEDYIYDDSQCTNADLSNCHIEYEFNLSSSDMQEIRRNTKNHYDYGTINFCTDTTSEDESCMRCNADGKECESTFITMYSENKYTDYTRKYKWKYFYKDTTEQKASWHLGTIQSLGYFQTYAVDGVNRYPDTINCLNGDCTNQEYYLKNNNNWP